MRTQAGPPTGSGGQPEDGAVPQEMPKGLFYEGTPCAKTQISAAQGPRGMLGINEGEGRGGAGREGEACK